MWVIAHRGASFDLPENTLPAFERAIELGADFVEFDVHEDRSGALVVTHDPPRGDHPSLEDVLDLCHGRIGVMAELKRPAHHPGIVPRMLALLDDDDVLVCFRREALEEARSLRPGMRTVQHLGLGTTMRSAGGAWAVGFADERATQRRLEAARRLDLETTVYTVNDPGRVRELAGLGASGIFTDRPDVALAALGRRVGG